MSTRAFDINATTTAHLADRLLAVHEALVAIFGAEPERIIVTSADHFCITADMRRLCIAAGGRWAQLVTDLEQRTAELKAKRYAGEDPRMKADK